jgi:hypothetical protein
MKIDCTIYDRVEGKQHCCVQASNEGEAYDEAGVVAAERGCVNVTEIVVGILE